MNGEKSRESGKSIEWKKRIEIKRRKGRKKEGGNRPNKTELLERERSWSIRSGSIIDEFFKKKGRKRK